MDALTSLISMFTLCVIIGIACTAFVAIGIGLLAVAFSTAKSIESLGDDDYDE